MANIEVCKSTFYYTNEPDSIAAFICMRNLVSEFESIPHQSTCSFLYILSNYEYF